MVYQSIYLVYYDENYIYESENNGKLIMKEFDEFKKILKSLMDNLSLGLFEKLFLNFNKVIIDDLKNYKT